MGPAQVPGEDIVQQPAHRGQVRRRMVAGRKLWLFFLSGSVYNIINTTPKCCKVLSCVLSPCGSYFILKSELFTKWLLLSKMSY
jgi:hypothetical protein